MDRKILHIRIAVATTVGAVVLSAAAGGQELSNAQEKTELTVLIGPNGSEETSAVRDVVRDWVSRNGHDARVAVAADIPGQLSQGFTDGDPADIFVLDAEHFLRYAERGLLLQYGDDLEELRDIRSTHVQNIAVDAESPCLPRKAATGSTEFAQCWGVAADTPAPEAALDLLRHLTAMPPE